MIKTIVLLTDYKGRFETKYKAKPYRSGLSKDRIKLHFLSLGYNTEFKEFSDIELFNSEIDERIFLYTSSEDSDNKYKSFIEDIIYGLELKGAFVLPSYRFLKAHNNKVFMEILRKLLSPPEINNIKSFQFGCYEDFSKANIDDVDWVYKSSSGSQSEGVGKGKVNEIKRSLKRLSYSSNLKQIIKEYIRSIKHKAYIKESFYRNKFIIQQFIPGINNDWKILIYGKKFFVLKRSNRKNDFRASGSGLFMHDENAPFQILDYAERVYKEFEVPVLSLDLSIHEENIYLFEFQALNFGTLTIVASPFHYIRKEQKWIIIKEEVEIEHEFCLSVHEYLLRNNSLNDTNHLMPV